jgi:outer membrane protein assembly factor BamB
MQKIIAMFLMLGLGAAVGALEYDEQWPQWRGPTGNGVAPSGKPPVEWSESRNVKWKVTLPGIGVSTPIIWDDQIIVTTTVPVGTQQPPPTPSEGAHDNMYPEQHHEYIVIALSRRDGSTLWDCLTHTSQPHESTHHTSSWSSASAVTDGEHIIAFFGSQGVCGLDMAGKLLWRIDLGDMQTKHGHGEGSSPALYGNVAIVNWDHEGDSFVVALDKHNGNELWRQPRDEPTSWSTPLIVKPDGKPQAIIAASNRVRSYELQSGEVIWECGGLSHNVVASPVAADGHVYVGSSYEFQAMLGINLATASGDITGTDSVVWTRRLQTPYVPSPLLYGELLYFIRHLQGFITCVEAKTGKTWYGSERLLGTRMIYASPVGADEHVYVLGRNGLMYVIEHGSKFKILARNQLNDAFSASPAIVGDELYLRGHDYLYCIKQDVN